MNEQELREIARATLASMRRLQVKDGLSEEEKTQAQRDITRTVNYWHRLAYPELYRRPAWFARVRHWLMDWRRNRVE
jgi:hypothetical protein